MATEWDLVGTGRLNNTGGAGTFTAPKALTESLMANHGKDYAIFEQEDRVMFVPVSEVDIEGDGA